MIFGKHINRYYLRYAPQLLLVNRSGTDAANRYQAEAHSEVLRLGATLDTQCRFVEISDALYLVRNLTDLRMEPYGMLVLGLDREKLLAPLLDMARRWDARLDVRLDDMDAVNLSGASGMDEAVDWNLVQPGQIAPVSVGMYACVQLGDSRVPILRRTEDMVTVCSSLPSMKIWPFSQS